MTKEELLATIGLVGILAHAGWTPGGLSVWLRPVMGVLALSVGRQGYLNVFSNVTIRPTIVVGPTVKVRR